jgi:predicted transcriptional regulator
MFNLFKMFRKDAKDTSVEAAKSIMLALPNIEAAVYEYAAMRGTKGFTDDEMNEHFETHKSTYRARRASLVEKGFVEDSGARVKGPNGRNMTVWRII